MSGANRRFLTGEIAFRHLAQSVCSQSTAMSSVTNGADPFSQLSSTHLAFLWKTGDFGVCTSSLISVPLVTRQTDESVSIG